MTEPSSRTRRKHRDRPRSDGSSRGTASGVTLVMGISLMCSACVPESGRTDPVSSDAGRPTCNTQRFAETITDHRQVSYQVVTEVQTLLDYSHIAVIGTIDQLVEGGVAGGASTTIAHISVLESLKGAETTVYVELPHSPVVATSDLQQVQPACGALWILHRALEASSSPLDRDRGVKGVPPGQQLFAPVSPQGIIMETDDEHLAQPLEPDPTRWLQGVRAHRTLASFLRLVTDAG